MAVSIWTSAKFCFTQVFRSPDENDLFGETPLCPRGDIPGADRPLTQARYWRRAKDRLVNIELADGRRVRGRLATPQTPLLRFSHWRRIHQLPDVARAVVEVEFNSPKGRAAMDIDVVAPGAVTEREPSLDTVVGSIEQALLVATTTPPGAHQNARVELIGQRACHRVGDRCRRRLVRTSRV